MPTPTSVSTFAVAYTQRDYFKFFPTGHSLPSGRRTVVVKVVDRDGFIGWGQAVPSPRWSYETPESVRSAIEHYLAPELIDSGIDLDDVDAIERRLHAAIAPSFSTGMPIAKAALDLALWDLRGRRAGKSVGELMAQAYPSCTASIKPVTLSWTINVRSLDEVEAKLDEARRRGYRHFNVKVAPDPAFDLELCRKVRAAAPDGFLWADANGGYDFATAQQIAPKLADLGFAALEQPLPANRLHDYRRLRAMKALPILLDESIVAAGDFDEFHRLEMLDGVAVKVSRMGGLSESLRLVKRLHETGSLYFASGLTDPDLSLAASLHLFTATGLALPAALNAPQYLAEDSILRSPLKPEGDQLMAPSGPGLGVEVDEGALERILET
jgi:muconate cycloisomerase